MFVFGQHDRESVRAGFGSGAGRQFDEWRSGGLAERDRGGEFAAGTGMHDDRSGVAALRVVARAVRPGDHAAGGRVEPVRVEQFAGQLAGSYDEYLHGIDGLKFSIRDGNEAGRRVVRHGRGVAPDRPRALCPAARPRARRASQAAARCVSSPTPSAATHLPRSASRVVSRSSTRGGPYRMPPCRAALPTRHAGRRQPRHRPHNPGETTEEPRRRSLVAVRTDA